MTDGELMDRGVAAQLFRDSPVYVSVREELMAEWTAQIVASDFEDAAVREQYFRLIRAFQLLDAELEARAIVAEQVIKRHEQNHIDSEEDFERG
jgi:hypothetical protein